MAWQSSSCRTAHCHQGLLQPFLVLSLLLCLACSVVRDWLVSCKVALQASKGQLVLKVRARCQGLLVPAVRRTAVTGSWQQWPGSWK
jgi:hypothetical protein